MKMAICKCFQPTRDAVNVIDSEVIRIMVVGEQMSGKTSLIKKYVYDAQPTHHQFTIGINFELKNVKKDTKPIRLHIFDSGFHIYNELVRNIISNNSIEFIIVCVDLTGPDSFHAIREWEERLEDLDNFDECKIVVCGTKADLRKPGGKMNHDSVMSKSTKVINYFETSSESGQNILEVFDFIVDFYWLERVETVQDKFLNE